ncbi:14677_t:CDS:2 [Dentiscutata erythropus]|uniref:14677_t:CDS:1 n=1 Tax=Dentiscutata erythropus TaxID=1348616 RepID=A0A9N9BR12_9GLOM|nr:14677_t:CDS:2 [Dentiscutata erythropus]
MSSIQNQKPKRIAIVGSGISGLGSSWLLSEHSPHDVVLYEQNDYIGGHTHTVDYIVPTTKSSANPKSIPVDTGFIVFNHLTYPNLIRFFKHKNVEFMKSEMSFSFSRNHGEFEWSGKNLLSVFAQPKNLLNIDMWKMLYDVLRFNFHATELLNLPDDHPEKQLKKCTLDFPALTLIQFMHNHCLLQVLNRIDWLTVKGGSRKYVESIISNIKDIRLSTQVVSITREPSDSSDPTSSPIITIIDDKGRRETFDHVIFATHADQALKILGDQATEEEIRILGNVHFSKNRAVLHSDLSLMPTRRLAFSAWNYLSNSAKDANEVSLTYSMNILQSIDESSHGPVLVSLNPLWEPDSSKLFDSWTYEHPQYTPTTIASQKALSSIQNLPHLQTSFTGAWTNYGFHEDGFTSGIKVATEHLGAECPFEIIDATYIRGKQFELSAVEKVQKRLWNGFEWSITYSKPLVIVGFTIASVYFQQAFKLAKNFTHDQAKTE